MKAPLALVTLFLISNFSFSQTAAPKDSLKLYRKIEKAAARRKITYLIYKSVFNLPENVNNATVTKRKRERVISPNRKHQGKIIRSINVQTLDPFGFSVADTNIRPKNFFMKAGNRLHLKTTTLAIRGQLLFKTGDSLDYLRISESERLLRNSAYARNAVIYVIPVKNSKDSVDILVREQDVFSISAAAAYSNTRNRVVLTDKNFLGLTNQLQIEGVQDKLKDRQFLLGSYSIPYIRNTYVTATGYFNTNPHDFLRGFTVDKSFYSPIADWAGGVSILDRRNTNETVYPPVILRTYAKDFWYGRSFAISKDTSEEARTTKFIVAARHFHNSFKSEMPADFPDARVYEDSRLYLTSFSLSTRNYYRDFFIYRFGIPEDVPAGKLFQLLTGYETRQSGDRTYFGFTAAMGNHFDIGYLNLRLDAGSFFRRSRSEQGSATLTAGYFSDLFPVGTVIFRQFIRAKFVHGYNRFFGENINLSEIIPGNSIAAVVGLKKAILSFQTQAYLPIAFLGFRFAPFAAIHLGLVSEEDRTFLKSRVYPAFNLGIIIRNELLVFNTFQFAIGYYPGISGDESRFRFNPVKSYDFRFNDFDVIEPYTSTFN